MVLGNAICACCNINLSSNIKMAGGFHTLCFRANKKETVTSTMLEYGDPNGYSSMAKLVGIPCGVAAQQVLDGIISTPGILAPMNAKINDPLIETLKMEGIECKEEVVA